MILIILLIICVLCSFIARKILLKNKLLEEQYYREIPYNDTPAYVGKIIKGNLDGNDIIATILDLKYKGYIDIQDKEIKGKNKKIIYFKKDYDELRNLEEHEVFLINQIFKNNKEIIFDDYIKSKKFKNDFKSFDKMIERRIERKVIYKNSILKNISKIILLVTFILLGINIFYSLLAPITLIINNTNIEQKIIVNLVISEILSLGISYMYITYINKSTNVQDNINLNIVYIVLTIIIGICLLFIGHKEIFNILVKEYNNKCILINFISASMLILYMFNIIKHTEKQEYMYYIFLTISVISLLLNIKILMCISIIFWTTYIFFKFPKNKKIKENDYIYKWLMFKKYIEHYSILSEQEESALLIWDKYLIYAIALGVNKKIVKKYSKLSNNILINDEYIRKFYIEYLE